MSCRELIASLVNSSAWPVAVIVLVLILRKPLVSLLNDPKRIKRIKAGPSGFEVELFDEKLNEAKETATDVRLETELEAPEASGYWSHRLGSSSFMAEMEGLARISPRAAILEAFTRLEVVLRLTLSEIATDHRGRPAPAYRLIDRAVELEMISPQEASLVQELRILRNSVAHTQDAKIDYARAVGFAEVAYQAAIALRLSAGGTEFDGEPL